MILTVTVGVNSYQTLLCGYQLIRVVNLICRLVGSLVVGTRATEGNSGPRGRVILGSLQIE